MTEQLDLLVAARALRDEGMARTTAAAGDDEISAVDKAIARMARSGDVFSANDVRDEFTGVRGPLIGARFNSARMRGLIVPVSYTPSTQPTTHGHPIRTWRGSTEWIAKGRAA